ncbi:suppressor of fused domain protein [Corynebacterium glaucum]|uniref:suppressor of fused domain protein n=1 Tax=Corynebacterium glaucum TaxID=187491 RepID=UPI0025B601F8|nr:suppressor of fused domain protein [Corynebacterium glaucum]
MRGSRLVEVFNFFNKTQPEPEDREGPEDVVDFRLAPILGEDYTVFHELISDELHIDVYCWEPTQERPFWTLVTSGMNEYRMPMPQGSEEYNRTELVMTLPGDWPLAEINSRRGEEADRIAWPMNLIKSTARLPKDMNTWLGYGTTIQAGPDLHDTYPGSEFSGIIIGGVLTLDTEGNLLATPVGNEKVHFLGVYPVYPSEMEAALAQGCEPVLDLLYDGGFVEGAHPGRPALI